VRKRRIEGRGKGKDGFYEERWWVMRSGLGKNIQPDVRWWGMPAFLVDDRRLFHEVGHARLDEAEAVF
jgi:hypothetical protein